MEAIIEPRPGGRWYERAGGGSDCEWGRVLTWQPPERIVLSWKISADWVADRSIQSEVDVRFFAEGPERNRVEHEHRRLTTFGDRAAEMHGVFDSERGWERLLALSSAAATATSPTPINATTPVETER
ncbi:hypothetical protein BH20ACT4_BH20ACT4_00240 [soil metagenome]